RPDCGRASSWSSIITATTCCRATAGATGTPSSGAATTTGVGFGVGDGLAAGPDGDAPGASEASPPDDAGPGAVEAPGDGVGPSATDVGLGDEPAPSRP